MNSAPFPASSVGFGGGSLMGRTTGPQSRDLVETALDAGVSHFDTARSYGRGESEALLGKTLRGRDDVTITTKVGLGRPGQPRLLSAGLTLARAAISLMPVRNKSGDIVSNEVESRPSGDVPVFNAQHVRASVDTSRRLLRRDTLDCLLLHEVELHHVTNELEDVLADLIQRQVVRRVGIATRASHAKAIAAGGKLVGTVLQVAGGPLNDRVDIPSMVRIEHSMLGPGGNALRRFMKWLELPDVQQRWLASSGAESLDIRSTGDAILRYAASEAPAILISSSSSAGLRRSIGALAGKREPLGERSDLTALFGEFRAAERRPE